MSSITSLLSSSQEPSSGWEVAGTLLSSTASFVVRHFDQIMHIVSFFI